jgi:protein gp37
MVWLVLEKMNKTKIEWTDYTWNPVVGCKNECWYCYAKRMNDRFKWIAKWDKPKFFIERLKEPYNLKEPNKIFVCSVADLFGDWVPGGWIDKVIEVAIDNPEHTFQFLTKNPKRYLELEFPENCWLGLTIDKVQYDTNTKVNIMRTKSATNYTFISFEPLLGDMSQLFKDSTGECMKQINLAIVGAMTGRGSIKPEKEWIDSIKHKNIFYKDNIKKYL